MPTAANASGIQVEPYVVTYDRNRFPIQPRREDGSRGCRGCGGVIPRGRSAWCSRECCDRWHPAYVMSNVRERDKEICVLCGWDLKKAQIKWWNEKPDYLKSGWEIFSRWQDNPPRVNYDHIIPFSEGGMTTLENIRTLCEECHKKRTKDWHKERRLSTKRNSSRAYVEEIKEENL